VYPHSFAGHSGAGWQHFGIAFHLNYAKATSAQGGQAVQLAESGNADVVSAGNLQDRFVVASAQLLAVDG
jgi:hypothetical protein